MNKNSRTIVAGILSLALTAASLAPVQEDSAAATKRKLSPGKVTVSVGKTKKVTVKNAKGKKIKWQIKKKKIASFKKSGKYSVKVKGKKKGSTTLICKVKVNKKWKSLKCKITVKAKKGSDSTPAPAGGNSTAPGNKTASPTPAGTGNTDSPTPSSSTDVKPSADPTTSPTTDPSTDPTTSPDPTPFQPVELLNTGFENGTDGFAPRGSASLSTVSGGRSGKALSVTGRTNNWNGASWDVTSLVAKGAVYTFSAWVKHGEEGQKAIKLSADLKTSAGQEYPEIAMVSCESGVWTQIEGTYTTPDKFSSLQFYFEGPDGNYDFLVDDLVITQTTEGVQPLDPLTLPSLKESYSGIFERIGNILNYDTQWNQGTQLQEESTMKFAQKQFNSFTLENELKPSSILSDWGGAVVSTAEAKNMGYVIPDNYKETSVPVLNFDTLDRILEKIDQYGIQMRAHVLMWHQQTASRFFHVDYDTNKGIVSPEVMDARLEFYIRSVMKHVMEKEKALTGSAGTLVYCWDVTNEYIHRTNAPTSTSWMDVYGDMGLEPSYVKKGYEFAYDMLKQYGVQDKVVLFYNDYDEYDCADDIIKLVEFINKGEETKICGGIGMQSHMSIEKPTLALYGETLDKFLATGLQVQVTELDIGIDEGKTKEDQADRYKAIMSLIREKHEKRDKTANPKGVTGVTIWGLYDSISWRKDSAPLLFGEGIDDPKPAFYSVLEAAK